MKTMPVERRNLKDRRQKPTRPLSRYTFVGRRKITRRSSELDNYYVDRHGWHLLLLIGLILIFCVLDVIFTLKINQLGGLEWNRLMLFFMEKNLTLSLIVKFLITSVCAVFLLLHKNFRVFGIMKTHTAIYVIFSVYLVLVLYEFYTLVLLNWI